MAPVKRLLIVSSIPAFLKSVASELRARGLDVFEAEEGLRGVKIFSQAEADAMPEAVVVDSECGSITGLEVIQQIRIKAPQVRALFVTDSPWNEQVQRVKQMGVPFVTKPVNAEMLLQLLSKGSREATAGTRVLLASNMAHVRLPVRRVLGRFGAETIEEDTGAAAWQAIATGRVSVAVLFTGLSLPNEWEILERMGKLASPPAVVICTAHAGPDLVSFKRLSREAQRRAALFLKIPADDDTLYEQLRKVMPS